MGGFGDNVSALLDTYSKCLGLLKAFKGHKGSSDTKSVDTALSDAHSRLQSSIRSDRTQVRRAYTSKLSKNGTRLEKGDARSRSALRRILDKLKSAILNLLSMAKTQRPAIDYESLMSLSNSSRIDAIRTMDQLSHRLSSSSSLLWENRRPISSGSSSASRKNSKQSLINEPKHRRNAAAAMDVANRRRSKVTKSDVSLVQTTPKSLRNEGKKTTKERSRSSHSHSRGETPVSPTTSDTSRARTPNRISFVSVSSASTKLGEIPYRRSRLVRISDSSSLEEYDIQPVFPLHPYSTPPREKRGLLRRIFGS